MTISIPITPQLVACLLVAVPVAVVAAYGWFRIFRGIRGETADTRCALVAVAVGLIICGLQFVSMCAGHWFIWDFLANPRGGFSP